MEAAEQARREAQQAEQARQEADQAQQDGEAARLGLEQQVGGRDTSYRCFAACLLHHSAGRSSHMKLPYALTYGTRCRACPYVN